jgi:hypothetical protein
MMRRLTMRRRVGRLGWAMLWCAVFVPSYLVFQFAQTQIASHTELGAMIGWYAIGIWLMFVASALIFCWGLRAK